MNPVRGALEKWVGRVEVRSYHHLAECKRRWLKQRRSLCPAMDRRSLVDRGAIFLVEGDLHRVLLEIKAREAALYRSPSGIPHMCALAVLAAHHVLQRLERQRPSVHIQ